ncbi:MAG: hypothetical protein AAFU77_05415 [Myxococcota bacterium]
MLIVTDQIRLVVTGQPLVLSLVPLAVCILAVLVVGRLRNVSKDVVRGIGLTALFCVYGTLASVVSGMGVNQVVAGWLAYTAFIPALLVFYAVGADQQLSHQVVKTVEFLLVSSSLVAFAQQFGFLDSEFSQVLEETASIRGVAGIGTLFSYTPGPFRTASVFSMFLAMGILIYVSGQLKTMRSRQLLVLVLALVASLMAARRAGLVLLVAAAFPYMVGSLRSRGTRVALAAFGVAAFFAFLVNPESGQEVEAKFLHATTHSGAKSRLAKTFTLNESDYSLLTGVGAGLGSFGIATRGGGRSVALRAKARLVAHPITHFGWFMDLAALGPVGFAIRLAAFFFLIRAVVPARWNTSPGRWSGPFGIAASIGVYLFIAPSWLQGVSGAVLFGAALGFVTAKAEKHRAARTTPSPVQTPDDAQTSSDTSLAPTARSRRGRLTSTPRPTILPPRAR